MNTSFHKNQIRLGRISGIPLMIDYSWLLVLLFITWVLAVSYFPSEYHDWLPVYYWGVSVITSVLFFISVILHEVGHSVTAKHYNYKVKKIKLFIFGGISEITEEPKKASEEFWIAIAGPAVTFILAAVFYLFSVILKTNIYLYALFHYLAIINLFLFIFNLIPGFPLDGGRVLRAMIWGWNKNFEKATQISATVGRVFGFFIIMIGFLQMISGYFASGLWVSFIGWFLESAAFSQVQRQEISKLLAGHTVGDAMSKAYGLVPDDTTISEFIENEILIRHRRFFIVEHEGKYIGLLTIHDIKNVRKENWNSTFVTEIMKPIDDVKKVDINFPMVEALKEMDKEGVNQLPVVEDGEIVGVLSRDSLITFFAGMHSRSSR